MIMLVDMFPRLTSAYESIFDYSPFEPRFFEHSNVNRVNESDSYKFEVVLPGLSKDDINVSTKGKFLYITAKSSGDQSRQVSFDEWFSLPDNLDTDNVTANYEQGILTVKFPKLSKSSDEAKSIVVN